MAPQLHRKEPVSTPDNSSDAEQTAEERAKLKAAQRLIPAHVRAQAIEAGIEKLTARFSAFDADLDKAMLSEEGFYHSVDSFANSLDAFILHHVAEDHRLSRMVNEDSRLARKAKKDYDVLASRFDDDVRPRSPTRVRECVTTASVYCGIVVSLVLMAPLHAVWSVLSKVLRALHLLVHPASAQPPRRTSPPSSSLPSSSSLSPRVVHTAPRARGVKRGIEMPTALSGAALLHGGAASPARHAAAAAEPRDTDGKPTISAAATGAQATDKGDAPRDAERKEGRDSSDDEDDVFVDTVDRPMAAADVDGQTDAQTDAQQKRKDGSGSRVDGRADGGGKLKGRARPGWAIPADESDAFKDDSHFPSGDFWRVSTDEIKLESLKNSASRMGVS